MSKQKRVNARLTNEQYNKLVGICKRKGMTISQWIASRVDLARLK